MEAFVYYTGRLPVFFNIYSEGEMNFIVSSVRFRCELNIILYIIVYEKQ